jgi:hypothetical protein
MYRLEFGQNEKLTAYIFEVDEYNMQPLAKRGNNTAWVDVIGAGGAVNILYDEEGGSPHFPANVIKTSVNFKFLRVNNNEGIFQDLISGEDNNWRCVITRGETYLFINPSNSIRIRNNSGDAKVAYYGMLTNESYGEQYKVNAEINMTFHDRIGVLNEFVYDISTPLTSFTDLLYSILNPLPNSNKLKIEFPYSYDGAAIAPNNLLLDTRSFDGKKNLDILKTVLKDFGLQLFSDYSEVLADNEFFYNSGAIRIRHLGEFHKSQGSYYKFVKDSGGYVADGTETEFRSLRLLVDDYPIEASGSWDLVRRAKYLDAINAFQPLSSIFFPATIEEKHLTPMSEVDSFTLYDKSKYNTATDKWYFGVAAWDVLKGLQEKRFSPVAVIDGKLGMMIMDSSYTNIRFSITSERALMVKGTNPFDLELEAYQFGVDGRKVNYSLVAYNPVLDTFFTYNHEATIFLTEKTWYNYPVASGFPLANEGIITTRKTLTSAKIEGIPQPPINDSYYIVVVVYMADFQAQQPCYITDCRMTIDRGAALPTGVRVRTLISETRRSPITENYSFHNLPLLDGDVLYFQNGIYLNDDGVIIAPETITYDGNDATLLVHQSELIGNQMTEERWNFKGKIIEPKLTESILIIAEWLDFYCDIEDGDNNGYERATSLRIAKFIGGDPTSNNEYSILDAIPDTAFGSITLNDYRALSVANLNSRITAFVTYIESEESITISEYEMNTFRQENQGKCALVIVETQYISASLQWLGGMGATDGMGGTVDLFDSASNIVESYTIPDYSKLFLLSGKEIPLGGGGLSFGGIVAYSEGSGTAVAIEWRANFEGTFNTTSDTDIYTETTQIETTIDNA